MTTPKKTTITLLAISAMFACARPIPCDLGEDIETPATSTGDGDGDEPGDGDGEAISDVMGDGDGDPAGDGDVMGDGDGDGDGDPAGDGDGDCEWGTTCIDGSGACTLVDGACPEGTEQAPACVEAATGICTWFVGAPCPEGSYPACDP